MKIRVMVFPGFVTLLAALSGCRMHQAAGSANLPATADTNRTIYGVKAHEVFASVGIEGVTNSVLMAHTSAYGQVIVAGRRGEQHVAAVARRDDYHSPDRPWRLCYVQLMMTDGLCV